MAQPLDLLVHLSLGRFRQEWCDRCNTLAGLRVTVYALMPWGPLAVGDIECCSECDKGRHAEIVQEVCELAQVRLRITGGR